MKQERPTSYRLSKPSDRVRTAWDTHRPQAIVPSEDAQTIHVFGPLLSEDWAQIYSDWWGDDYHVSDVSFLAALEAADASQPITLLINSPGGDVFVGATIRSAIQAAQSNGATINAHVMGLCASAGALVATACTEVRMADAAQFMVHRASVGFDYWGYGDTQELALIEKDVAALRQSLKSIDAAQVKAYVAKTGRPQEDIRAEVNAETWFDAEAALDAGYVDTIQEAPTLKSDKKKKKEGEDDSTNGSKQATQANKQATQRSLRRSRASHPAATAAAQGINNQPEKGLRTMHENTIRELLGLSADTEVTDAHRDLAISQLLVAREEGRQHKAENERLVAQARDQKVATLLDKHQERGAVTPAERDGLAVLMLNAPDLDAALATMDATLSKQGDESKVARQAQGTGLDPEGSATGTGRTKDEGDHRALAHAFDAKVKALCNGKDDSASIGDAQRTALDELGEDAYNAYVRWDFDNDQPTAPIMEMAGRY